MCEGVKTISISNISSIMTKLCSPNEDFGKMNKDEMRIFDVLCECVSTGFGRRTFAKHIEKTRQTCCYLFGL